MMFLFMSFLLLGLVASHRMFTLMFPTLASARKNDDENDAGNRPCKRIKLETTEVGSEADVSNLQKPQLGIHS